MSNNNSNNRPTGSIPVQNNSSPQAFIPADQTLPEITIKAIVLAFFLVIILAAANAYLGLKLGNTISASIPAAVISMGVLRFFRKSNILENNIVQTAASAGEALISATAYILPALIILHYWQKFNYWETTLISIIGGTLGVLFSVPLRRVLLAQSSLRFPEGTAIGEVLKASSGQNMGLGVLVKGGLIGGLISFFQAGLQVISQSWDIWFKTPSNTVYGFGLGFDAAILAAGYIIGINVAVSMLVGVIIGWIIGVPFLTFFHGIPVVKDAAATAIDLWRTEIRYVGVGTMLLGGLWTLVTLVRPIMRGLYSSFASVKGIGENDKPIIPRTEYDLPIQYVTWCLLFLLIPLGLLLYYFSNDTVLQLGAFHKTITVTFGILFVIIIGFIFSAIGGYFAGLLGSTNSPGSSLNIAAILLVSLFILMVLGSTIHFDTRPDQTLAAAGLAIIITSILSCSIVITNETIQDLKAGQIVGATPWKQQIMLIFGTLVAAVTIPFVLQLLFEAYGIGGVFPHPGMDPNHMLAAPQAGLAAALAQGVFVHQLPLVPMAVGALIAIICIPIDTWLKNHKGTRLPVLAVGVAIYLPITVVSTVIIGGVSSYIIEKIVERKFNQNKEAAKNARERGLILACGLVAGAALMGVILAIPFAISQSTDVLKIVSESFTPFANVLGVLVTLGLVVWIGRVVCANNKS